MAKNNKIIKLWILNPIGEHCGETSAVDVKNQIEGVGEGDTIEVHLNSGGGNVFQGIAIMNLLKGSKAQVDVYIHGMAGSIASVIATAGDNVFMSKSSLQFIHMAETGCWGNSSEMFKTGDDLNKISSSVSQAYLSKLKNTTETDLVAMLKKETYLTAQECFTMGLCTEILDEMPVAGNLSYDDNVLKMKTYFKKQTEENKEKEEKLVEARKRAEAESQNQLEKVSVLATHEQIYKACLTADMVNHMEMFVDKQLSFTDVQNKIAVCSEIKNLCAAAQMPEAFQTLLPHIGNPVKMVAEAINLVKTELDPEIDGHHNGGKDGTKAQEKSNLDVTNIFNRLNNKNN